MGKSKVLDKVKEYVSIDDLKQLADGLLDAGGDPDEVAEEIAAILDDLIDWRKVLGGVAGTIAEKFDGPLLTAAARVVTSMVMGGGGTTPYAPTVGTRPAVGEPTPTVGSITRTVR